MECFSHTQKKNTEDFSSFGTKMYFTYKRPRDYCKTRKLQLTNKRGSDLLVNGNEILFGTKIIVKFTYKIATSKYTHSSASSLSSLESIFHIVIIYPVDLVLKRITLSIYDQHYHHTILLDNCARCGC